MKTITKTFYCTYEFYKELQSNDVLALNTFKGDCWTIPIQISWQEPEKKIEITESEFDEAVFSFFKLDENNNSPISRGVKMQEHLKQKLFGNREV